MTVVYLAVGHGVKPSGTVDPGAVSAVGRWTEVTAGEHIVGEAVRRLRAAGVEVLHEAASGPNFVGTVKAANAARADLLVEVHHDWNRAPVGAFVHWWPGSTAGKALADDVLAGIIDGGFRARRDWHKARDDLYLLRKSRMPAALVEVGRIGQDDLDTPAELRSMGAAIAAGLARHLGTTATPTAEAPVAPGPFPDVPADHAHADGIAAALEAGLVNGYPDGTFRPDEPVTRGQLATVVARLVK